MSASDYFELTPELIDHFESLSWLEADEPAYKVIYDPDDRLYFYSFSAFQGDVGTVHSIFFCLGEEDGVEVSITHQTRLFKGIKDDAVNPWLSIYYFQSDFVNESILNEAWGIYKKLLEKYSLES